MTGPGRAAPIRQIVMYLSSFIEKEVAHMDSIVQVVSTLGFPIACSIVMFYMWDREREAHDAEVKEITKAINNNNTLLQRLLEHFSGGDSHD